MSNEPSPGYWKTVLTHEAGHAVAALVIHDAAADIFVKAANEGPQPFAASYRWGGSEWSDLLSGRKDPTNEIIALAAGAKAEMICLGITQSAGFPGDRSKIYNLQAMWDRMCSEGYWRSLFPPGDALDKALHQISQHVTKLKEMVHEIESDYSRTAGVLTAHRDVLESIESEAHDCLQSIGEHNLNDGTILLSERRVREMWVMRQTKRIG